MQLFGFEIKRKDEQPLQSFAPEVKDDGAVIVAAGGAYGTYIDLDGTARTEAELVSKYREISLQPELEAAIDDIVNEAIDTDAEKVVDINLDKVKYSDQIKQKITEEFNTVLRLLNFQTESYELFKRWYVDGRIYYHVIIDEKDPRQGIKELRYLDPRKIRKIREVKKTPKGPIVVQETKREYYVYSDRSFMAAPGNAGIAQDNSSTGGLRIATDSILHVTSGLMDKNNQLVYSYIQKAIKPLNQLRTLEDATVIYRISRAPERRIFYIDVGSLPKVKAEQYLRDMMVRHKNRLVYDAATGEVRDDRKYMTMLEDYWLPRREGGKGTEITTLPSGQNLGEMADVEYFQKKLYQSLNVPVSRLNQETANILGRASEISRDEVKFTKFVGRLRRRFSHIFLKALEKQLVLKGIVSENDWKELEFDINFDFTIDNHFEEFKEIEVLQNRIQILNQITPYIGRYYSDLWVRKNILRQSEQEIADMMDEMASEKVPLTPMQDPGMPAPPAPIANRPSVENTRDTPNVSGNDRLEDIEYYDEHDVLKEEIDIKQIELLETMKSYLEKE
jgi:hypothetical protein